MEKILVMSDNHFQEKELKKIVEKHKDECSYMIHCGDSQWSVSDSRLSNMLAVKGNNDFQKFPEELLVNIAGKNIYITHGHRQDVYFDDSENLVGTRYLAHEAKKQNANIAIYGHTHVPEFHRDGDLYVLNPGSTNFPRNYGKRIKSYAILTIDGDTVDAQFYNAETHENITNQI